MKPLVLSSTQHLASRALLPAVAIHGRHSDWHKALNPHAQVWQLLAGTVRPAGRRPSRWRKRVVIPLMERHIATLPPGCHALAPGKDALAALADKAAFARHAHAVGAAQHVPRTLDLANPTFPAVLKRTDLNASLGVALVTSAEHLASLLAQSPFAGHPVLLQEAVLSGSDHVTHLVCERGRVVWSCTYVYLASGGDRIRTISGTDPLGREQARPEDIAAIEALLRPLDYDGPANVDFKRRADGSIAIFEINPRLGGSLMRPHNVHDLAECLETIVKHARWRPAAEGTNIREPERVPA